MMTRRVLIGSATGLLLANELVAAQAGANGPRVVFEHDVPDLTMKGWSASGVEVLVRARPELTAAPASGNHDRLCTRRRDSIQGGRRT